MLFIRIIAIFLISLSANAAEYGNLTVNEVTSIYNADTFRVIINSWPDIIGKRVAVHVLGIDVPELKDNCKAEKIAAREAKQHTVILREGKLIELRNMQRGK